jgi:hypothetical protein
MAINYSNAFKEILDALKEILYNETKLKVHHDKDYEARASQYFNITPVSSNVVSRFSGGSTREYNVDIRFYLQKGNYDKHTHIDYLTDTGEKITRLFNDKNNPTSTNELFQGIISQFSESNIAFGSLVAYTFHDGRIENVNYQPDRSDVEEKSDLHIIDFEFIGIVTEVYL